MGDHADYTQRFQTLELSTYDWVAYQTYNLRMSQDSNTKVTSLTMYDNYLQALPPVVAQTDAKNVFTLTKDMSDRTSLSQDQILQMDFTSHFTGYMVTLFNTGLIRYPLMNFVSSEQFVFAMKVMDDSFKKINPKVYLRQSTFPFNIVSDVTTFTTTSELSALSNDYVITKVTPFLGYDGPETDVASVDLVLDFSLGD